MSPRNSKHLTHILLYSHRTEANGLISTYRMFNKSVSVKVADGYTASSQLLTWNQWLWRRRRRQHTLLMPLGEPLHFDPSTTCIHSTAHARGAEGKEIEWAVLSSTWSIFMLDLMFTTSNSTNIKTNQFLCDTRTYNDTKQGQSHLDIVFCFFFNSLSR